MNERLVEIMEMLTADGVKSSMALDTWGNLDIYLWNGMTIYRHISLRNVKDITDNDVAAICVTIQAYKKNLSLPAKHNAEI